MELNLKNKRVLITGSSRGIGLAIAEAFLHEGARVVITSRNQDDLNRLADNLGGENPAENVLPYQCDFTQTEEVDELKNTIVGKWEALDIVVSNVGDGRSVPNAIAPQEHFDKVFRVNFDSAVHTARTFYPLLKESQGNLLFIASITGLEALGAPVDYSVAKTAVIAYAKNLARKAAADGIRVNCIAPGNIYFEGGSWDERKKKNPEEVKKIIETTVPMQCFGTPTDIADAALAVWRMNWPV